MPENVPENEPEVLPGRGSAPTGGWQTARVLSLTDETPRAKTIRLALEVPTRQLAGQHYVVRLTAPDGYTASRSYSVASAPDGSGEIELTVERLDDGEVSTFLHEVVEPGDELEVRGPIGGWFVWPGEGRALLVGGGSGVVPLAAMLRHARALGRPDLVHLVVSVRTPHDLYYRDELLGDGVTVVYTREAPPGSARAPGRLRVDDLAPFVMPDATAFVCGGTSFCNAATDLLASAGVGVDRIRVERFGPTG
ncbi:MAG TPA: ferredoxin reductase [Acidimicrobiia bacterium]|nr:ferredoxin reductase [Acidimicrobiia bacterium]